MTPDTQPFAALKVSREPEQEGAAAREEGRVQPSRLIAVVEHVVHRRERAEALGDLRLQADVEERAGPLDQRRARADPQALALVVLAVDGGADVCHEDTP